MATAASTAASIDPRDVGTPDAWIPRHPELIRLTGRHPFNCEPPLAHLSAFITPTELHYVRNHGAVPRLAWDSHTLTINGLVDAPLTLSVQELVERFKEHVVTLPVLLVCAGNRRKEQNMLKKTIGFSWGAGAASTARWTGVPLHVLLEACGVDRSSAKFVWFEGADTLPHSSYGTCIPVVTALDPSCDVLVAWAMNDEPLSPDHGFPLRMIVPGHIGGRMVKWLKRIHVSDVESTNYHHHHDNRVLPSHVDAERATAEDWWSKPQFAIQELNVNSVMLAPAHGDKVDLSGDDFYTIKGYAYSGGGRKVIRVEVTLNDGATWQDCIINYTEKPNAYGKMWCWVHYELTVPVASLLRASEICVRAWDASMNTQPEFPTWNVMGMMNNPWFRVRVHRNKTSLAFEHPTQAGALKGGWMTPERISTSRATQKQEVAENEDEPTSEVSEIVVSVAQQRQNLVEIAAKLPLFSLADVAQHNSKESCWFVCHGLVFDATQFLNDHPGGAASILLCAGTDCTDEFESIHSTKAWQLLSRFLIGRCENASHDDDAASTSESMTASEEDDHETAVALRGAAKVPIVLIEKKVVSRDTRVFRFALPTKHLALGLPTGNHVFLYGNVHGKTVVRAYTPISENDDLGFVSFLIKVYFSGEDPRFPEGGVFSQYLDDLHLGSRIEMKGPLGHFTYHGLGKCTLEEQPVFHVRKFGLIAGGTGITPIYQLLRAILSSPDDPTSVSLIYCVRSDKDLLLKDEIDALQQLKPAQCRVFYTLTDMPVDDIPQDWPYGRTRLTTAMVEDVIGADASHVALCGPPGLIQYACLPALTALGYDCAVQVTQL